MSTPRRRALLGPAVLMVAAAVLAACSSSGSPSPGSSPSAKTGKGGLKTGLKVFVIPKNLGKPYFTTADSVKSSGALAALTQLGETGSETSGTAATPASQIPAIQAAITKGASALTSIPGERRNACFVRWPCCASHYFCWQRAYLPATPG